MNARISNEILHDVIDHNMKIIICGYAVGPKSARTQAYYAAPGNCFWNVLHEVGLTNHLIAPQNYKDIKRYNIGLTDLIKEQHGIDRDVVLEINSRQILINKILEYKPIYMAFNGKKSAKCFFKKKSIEYGKLANEIG